MNAKRDHIKKKKQMYIMNHHDTSWYRGRLGSTTKMMGRPSESQPPGAEVMQHPAPQVPTEVCQLFPCCVSAAPHGMAP